VVLVLLTGLARRRTVGCSQVRRADAYHGHDDPRRRGDPDRATGEDLPQAAVRARRGVPPGRLEAMTPRVGVFGPELTLVPDGALVHDSVVGPDSVVVPVLGGTGNGLGVSGLKCTTRIVVLGGGEQLVCLDCGDPEHHGQILGPDAVPVYQVQDLLGVRRSVGQHLAASEGKQPRPQLLRIVEQGLHGAHDRVRDRNRGILPAGEGMAVGDEMGMLSFKDLTGRPGAAIPGGRVIGVPARLVAVPLFRGNQELVRIRGRDPEHDGQVLRPDAVPVNEV
jgi:hypothetical protein